MITEQDVRAIYEGFYKVVSEISSSSHTDSISWELHCMLTNPGIVDIEKTRGVCRLAHEVDKEYHLKFEELAREQRKLEAQVSK